MSKYAALLFMASGLGLTTILCAQYCKPEMGFSCAGVAMLCLGLAAKSDYTDSH